MISDISSGSSLSAEVTTLYTEGKGLAISYDAVSHRRSFKHYMFYKQVRKHVSCLKMILWLPARGQKKQIPIS